MQQTQICQNCQKEIAVSKVATHFGYCRRNIIKCTVCDQMYDKNFQEQHELQFHKNTKCQFCSQNFKQNEIQNHKLNCTFRPKHCQYCELDVPLKLFAVHKKQCESRTVKCQKCDQDVLNKDFSIHTVLCKGKSKPAFKRQEFQDSLTDFHFKPQVKKQPTNKKGSQNTVKKQQIKKPIQDSVSINSTAKKQSKQKYQIKKSVPMSNNSTAKKQIKPERNMNNQNLSAKQEAIYNNYFGSASQFADYNYIQNQGFDQEEYLMQQMMFENSNFNKKVKKQQVRPAYSNQIDIDAQQQFIQQALLDSKFKTNKKQDIYANLPSDFYSQDLMNKSFYKDILQIEKQKAILEDLNKKKTNSRAIRK